MKQKIFLLDKRFLFILFIILSTSSCIFDTFSSNPTSETNSDEQPIGVSAGIQERPGDKYWRTYQVAIGESFSGYFYLANEQPAEEYLLTCLLDYRQVPCKFDGEETLLFPLNLGDFAEASIQFETPALTAGFHDFMMLAFAKPYEHDLSTTYRLSTDISYLTAQRLVLLVGDEPWEKPNIEHTVLGEKPRPDVVEFYGVLLNQEIAPEEWRAWTEHDVKAGKTISFYAHLGNNGGSDQVLAFMIFLDFKQVPLTGEDNWVSFANMPANTQAVVPSEVKAPNDPGVHELLVVYTADPYQMLEEPPLAQERSLTSFSDYVEPTLRTAIIVQE